MLLLVLQESHSNLHLILYFSAAALLRKLIYVAWKRVCICAHSCALVSNNSASGSVYRKFENVEEIALCCRFRQTLPDALANGLNVTATHIYTHTYMCSIYLLRMCVCVRLTRIFSLINNSFIKISCFQRLFN